jgi:hypothetical protein
MIKVVVGLEVVNDGFNGHSQGDVEGSTYATGMKTTLPSTDGWTVVNQRLRNIVRTAVKSQTECPTT